MFHLAVANVVKELEQGVAVQIARLTAPPQMSNKMQLINTQFKAL